MHRIVFTCSSAAEHLDWFCFLAFMNSEIINREVKVSPWYVSLRDSDCKYLEVAQLENVVAPGQIFFRNLHTDFYSGCTSHTKFTSIPRVNKHFSSSCQKLLFLLFLMLSILIRIRQIIKEVLILISLRLKILNFKYLLFVLLLSKTIICLGSSGTHH